MPVKTPPASAKKGTPKPQATPQNTSPARETSLWQRMQHMGTVSSKQVLFFTKNLSVMLKAGVTLTEALHILEIQTKGKLQYIIQQVFAQINEGRRFSDTLKPYPQVFGDMYTNMVAVGEESGHLDENLKQLSNQLEKKYAMRRKIMNAMFYPIMVLVGGVILSIGIVVFVLPKLTRLFSNFKVELPVTTRALLRLSDFVQTNGLLTLIAFLVVTIGGYILLRAKFMRPITHWMILRIPIVRMISRHLNLTLMCRTTGALLASGLTIDDAILLTERTVPNLYYKQLLKEMYARLKEGDALTDVLHKHQQLCPATDTQIIGVGETSGTLSDSLLYCAEIHEEEVENVTKNLAAALEPLLLITMGLMIGFLALSIITPMYSITSAFQQ